MKNGLFYSFEALVIAMAVTQGCYAQGIPHCVNDWIESEFFNESYSGLGPYAERLTTGPNRLTTGLEQAEWQYVGNGVGNSHTMAFNNGVLEVRHGGPGVKTLGMAQYTRAGSFTQRIEMKNVRLNGPVVGLISVINLFNIIVGGGDNQLVIQNPFGPSSSTWQAFVLNQSAVDGVPFNINAGTDIAVEVWFDEPSRAVRYLYDNDTTDAESAKLIATSFFTGAIDLCHRDQQLAITSISDGSGLATAHIDLDNWSYKTIATLPGDYDEDSDVDGRDFLIWQRSFGQTGSSVAADGNGDFIVDRFDLDMWMTNYNMGLTSTLKAGSSIVPEPTSIRLLLFVALLCLPRQPYQ